MTILSSKLARTGIVYGFTVIALLPIGATVLLSLRPRPGTDAIGLGFSNFVHVFRETLVADWLINSLLVSLFTVVAAIIVAAPAGYVISRGRNKLVQGYSLLLFVVQSLPIITAVIPLFMLFARLGLADHLGALVIIYVAGSLSVATWMMAAYFDTIPAALEEAAWIDGCSVFGGFMRIVLRNSLPGVLSTAIFTFLLSWNDYLVAIVFLKTDTGFTLPIGLQSFFQQTSTDWGAVMAVSVVTMLPPVIIFSFLNRYFSVGGIGGSLAGQ
ncbi:carbohydrate ABC transporter permease [Pelagovum pacificum]|uniref:Carbohydrate ABC transporter permease n=1 Tax=Pelagovum pacificum TaxID=2588711 RepID=A0A5C5GDT4_9RHOB|nr:carbohydrate ABC transporter permease [Pelagovum pacificum]QQA41441.1 carbohydrate ABC transporter permease [Pelagovum pacificum]TNY31756.1 carbohydrate ABC transporter permease [Pelagovum pacificum]